jgi:5-methyltetrahydropteroyltriglutamate--homocysteine methyltransferase
VLRAGSGLAVTVAGRFPVVVSGEHPMRRAVEAWRARGQTTPRAAWDDPELGRAQDETIDELVALQERAGVDLPSDGYVPVYDEWFAWMPAVSNVEDGSPLRYLDTNTYYHHWRIQAAPRRIAATPAIAAYRRAAGRTSRPVKPCLFGPYTLWAYGVRADGVGPGAFDAMVEVWAAEVGALAEAGCRYVQIEESVLQRRRHRGDVGMVQRALERIAAAAPEVRLILHLAGAAVDDPSTGSGPALLPRLLETPGLGGLGLDFSPAYRAANLAALAEWRGEALLQAGIVDARNVRLESRDELHDLLGAIARRLPAERILAAPSTALLYLPRRIALEKLDALVDAAHSFATVGASA